MNSGPSIRLVLGMLLLLPVSGLGVSFPLEWRRSVERAQQLRASGHFKAAERLLEVVLRTAQPTDGKTEIVAVMLNNLGAVHQDLGEYGKGRRAYHRALRLWEKIAGRGVQPLPPISAELREKVIASLPQQGEIRTLRPEWRQKLDSVAPVLKAHGRESDYVLKVVDSPQARVAIHARFVVLVTDNALKLLTHSQLQAVVAHEIGHEYVWEEYNEAGKRNDWSRVRELELFCDGVAISTLLRIGISPSALIDALRIMEAFDRRNGITLGHDTQLASEHLGSRPVRRGGFEAARSRDRHPLIAQSAAGLSYSLNFMPAEKGIYFISGPGDPE